MSSWDCCIQYAISSNVAIATRLGAAAEGTQQAHMTTARRRNLTSSLAEARGFQPHPLPMRQESRVEVHGSQTG